MIFDFWKLSREMTLANLAAQRVIALRMARLAVGGAVAHREAKRMIAEKIAASAEATAAIMSGKSPHSVVGRYRSIVGANERRLLRKRRH